MVIKISDYLDENGVLFFKEKSRNGILKLLVEKLHSAGRLVNVNSFYKAILEREGLVSTGIGIGVAIPHAKLSSFNEFFIGVGISESEGVEWNSLDGSLVKMIFMIGGPDNEQTKYLKVLSYLTRIIKDDERRSKLLKSNNAKDVIEILKNL